MARPYFTREVHFTNPKGFISLKKTSFKWNWSFSGLGERIRTSGLLNPIQARYQTALHPDIQLSEPLVFLATDDIIVQAAGFVKRKFPIPENLPVNIWRSRMRDGQAFCWGFGICAKNDAADCKYFVSFGIKMRKGNWQSYKYPLY